MITYNNKDLYNTIYKRKSFHLFKDIEEKLNDNDIDYIEDVIKSLKPLYSDILTEIILVPSTSTTCKRYEEYCILMYSEKKDGYLQNIGYMGEQLDLLLQKNDIATLWCGLASPIKRFSKLNYVIMFAVSKCSDESKYRKDMFKAKRKVLEEIWHNDYYKHIGEIVRFSPSACNSQPWIIEGDKNSIEVYRYTKQGKSGLMPEFKAHYFNSIDIGIFMYILEVILDYNNINYDVSYFKETKPIDRKYLNAIYKIKM